MDRDKIIRPDNYLTDREWETLLAEALRISRAPTHEDMRMSTFDGIRLFIPFDTAAFFLSDPKDLATIDCLIAQPLGQNAQREDFEKLRRSFPLDTETVPRQHVEVPETATGAPGMHALAANLAFDGKILGFLTLTRNRARADFNAREEYVFDIFSSVLAPELYHWYRAGDFSILDGQRIHGEFDLTKREIEISECICYGMTNPEISERLAISINTVKKHLENIYRKTGVNNRGSLMRLVQQYACARRCEA